MMMMVTWLEDEESVANQCQVNDFGGARKCFQRVSRSAFTDHNLPTIMSRPIITQQRGLTLPEELEKLEQQITLTLQEIDSNFSKAHRIVTSSILPIVEDYAKHSNDVWEGSKVCSSHITITALD